MSISSRQLGRGSSSEIDWNQILLRFGELFDMSYNEAIQWISKRTSLQVACEVMGIQLSPSIDAHYTEADLVILTELGDIVDEAGLTVPRLMERRRLQYQRRKADILGFTLSREEYLLERATGKSKNRIAKEQGISGPALFHWLHKWELRDSAIEQREIARAVAAADRSSGRIEDATHCTPSSSQHSGSTAAEAGTSSQAMNVETVTGMETARNIEAARGVEAPTDTGAGRDVEAAADAAATSRGSEVEADAETGAAEATRTAFHSRMQGLQVIEVTRRPALRVSEQRELSGGSSLHEPQPPSLSLPLGQSTLNQSTLPETIHPFHLSRDEMTQTALRLLLHSLSLAQTDLAALLGPDEANAHLQRYLDLQLKRLGNE